MVPYLFHNYVQIITALGKVTVSFILYTTFIPYFQNYYRFQPPMGQVSEVAFLNYFNTNFTFGNTHYRRTCKNKRNCEMVIYMKYTITYTQMATSV